MAPCSKQYSFWKPVALLLIHILFFNITKGQNPAVNLLADSLVTKGAEYSLNRHDWMFRAGDNPAWTKPDFPEIGWHAVKSVFGEDKRLPGWQGIGWFRLKLKAENALAGRTLALRINHDGASEIYVDGIYKGGFGRVSRSQDDMKPFRAPFELVPFQLNDTLTHVIAVRYSNYNAVFPDFIGFQAWVGDYNRLHSVTAGRKQLFDYILLSVAAQLTLAVLHLLLFLFYPRQRLNLYYSIFSVFFAGTNWAACVYNITTSPPGQYIASMLFLICCLLGSVSAWFLLYKVGKSAISRWKTILVSVITFLYLLKYLIFPLKYPTDGLGLVFLILMIDGFSALFLAIRRRQPYLWLIGLGMLIVSLLFFFVGVDILKLWTHYYPEKCLTMSIGLLAFPLCFSVYLALDFARTNENLSSRLVEVEELSAKTRSQEAEKLELITRQAEELEETVQQRTAEVGRQADRLREMDAVKSRFFINLTHEFRTPLTLIIGPAQQILSGADRIKTAAHADTIYRNARRLLQLINQLLDLSKLEAGKMELENTPVELVGLLRRNFSFFESLAAQKQITMDFYSEQDELYTVTDPDKIEKILYNLLSNAIKFTEQSGLISLELRYNESEEGERFELLVWDTGVGIPEAKMPYIFDRFYQVDPSDTRSREGTGIGLAITKELVELMGGKLSVSSREAGGTEMRVQLPVLATTYTSDIEMPAGLNIPPEGSAYISKKSGPLSDPDLPQVLVIEDNPELRAFICSLLAGEYRVIEAANGEEGIKAGAEYIPDLVITDLMMPLMDGYEVCATLKKDERTSHIPVVILTAKADLESRITGLELQADAYLGKPFDQRELQATLDNLISLRRQLRERYSKDNFWTAGVQELPSMEKVFLDRVRKSVEEHLDDEGYSVELLGEDIGLSRTQLHRKLKSIINQTPGDLIRTIRLERAHELLKNKTGTVAEIAYMVGFSNPFNFSTSFSRHFGFPPSEVTKT